MDEAEARTADRDELACLPRPKSLHKTVFTKDLIFYFFSKPTNGKKHKEDQIVDAAQCYFLYPGYRQPLLEKPSLPVPEGCDTERGLQR